MEIYPLIQLVLTESKMRFGYINCMVILINWFKEVGGFIKFFNALILNTLNLLFMVSFEFFLKQYYRGFLRETK